MLGSTPPADGAFRAMEDTPGLKICLFGPMDVQIGTHPMPRLRSRTTSMFCAGRSVTALGLSLFTLRRYGKQPARTRQLYEFF